MKKGLTYLILFVTISASMSRALIVGAFFINQDRIAQTLCENRAQPAKHCNGKCYLNKQLKQDDKSEKHSLPFSANEIFQEFIASGAIVFPVSAFINDERITHSSAYTFAYSHAYFSEIPHPPSV